MNLRTVTFSYLTPICIFLFHRRMFKDPLKHNDLSKLKKKTFSEQTMKKIGWACKLYTVWRNYCNETHPDLITLDLSDEGSVSVLSIVDALPKFITEVIKQNGEEYPGKTLYEMIICLQFHFETLGYMYKLLDDDRFVEVKYTLDNTMKDRTSNGIIRKGRKN